MAQQNQSIKRNLINKANTRTVMVVGISAFLVVFSLVTSKALVDRISYQNRVINAKKTTLQQVKADVAATDKLVKAYREFDDTPLNVIGGLRTGTGSKDGSNSKIVLDALPSKYDFPALATSLEKMISKYGLMIQGIQGTDDEVTQQANAGSTNPSPVQIPVQVTVSGNYTQIKDFINEVQTSIRPFQIQTIDVSGGESNMTLSFTANTYYQPEKLFNISKKVVK